MRHDADTVLHQVFVDKSAGFGDAGNHAAQKGIAVLDRIGGVHFDSNRLKIADIDKQNSDITLLTPAFKFYFPRTFYNRFVGKFFKDFNAFFHVYKQMGKYADFVVRVCCNGS